MKTYQLIGLKSHMQHVDITKNGNTTSKIVEFKGGSRSQGKLVPGTFKTDDPDIIKALEDSKNFNVKWKLIFDSEEKKESKAPEPKSKKVVKPKGEKNPPAGSETPEDKKGDEGTGTEGDEKTFPEVTTGQAAKQILLKEIEGLKVSDVNSNAQVKEVAEKHGFNFPNLNA